jgi:hypothetical protein
MGKTSARDAGLLVQRTATGGVLFVLAAEPGVPADA